MLHTLVAGDRMNLITEMLENVKDIDGDYWECGVFHGGTASHIQSIIPNSKKLTLFDSFEGLPAPTIHDNFHLQGHFSDVDYESVKSYFNQFDNVQLIKGWVPEVYRDFTDVKLCFVHIDLDLYEGYKTTLEFTWPRLLQGGVIVFDDYHADTCLGAKIAVDEFVSDNNIELMSRGNCYWIVKR